jgi:hypothetical protein
VTINTQSLDAVFANISASIQQFQNQTKCPGIFVTVSLLDDMVYSQGMPLCQSISFREQPFIV